MAIKGNAAESATLRADLSALQTLMTVSNSMLTCDTRDDILRLAQSSLPSLGVLHPYGIYVAAPGLGEALTHMAWSGQPSLVASLDALSGADGPMDDPTSSNRMWATAMRNGDGHQGYLVIVAEAEPRAADVFLLRMLAQQTAAALDAVSQRARLQSTTNALELSVGDLRQRTRAHELMADAAIHGDLPELAKTAHELTRLPVAIVDQFGHLLCRAPDDDTPSPWPHVPMPNQRSLDAAADQGRSIRLDELLVAAAKPGNDLLGGIVVLDPARTAGEFAAYVLERSAALLGSELGHRRALAETERRLHRELVVELVEGLEDEAAYSRAALLGHDLHQVHQVAALRSDSNVDDSSVQSWIEIAVRRADSQDAGSPMVGRRRGVQLAILRGGADADSLHSGLKGVRPGLTCAVGLGGNASIPAEFPRSYAEAVRALRVREQSSTPDGGTNFSDLGLYQILQPREPGGSVDSFVRRWLGALIDYDSSRHAEMVNTLAHFLDCGGNYDHAAESLLIHRSTLRYRLRRIRELGGLDLTDTETRLNVHVATRAWRVLDSD
ncbi:MAG: PucR C-terminal helix-turn-helix protein [Frankiales bacterium]|nr:PucR C-terminal helix-turn-helix protein [Frankiales bacterium]